jgi:hypothetical protein
MTLEEQLQEARAFHLKLRLEIIPQLNRWARMLEVSPDHESDRQRAERVRYEIFREAAACRKLLGERQT